MKLYNRFFFYFCLLVALLLSRLSVAQTGEDISGSSDHPLFDRFPDSQIVRYDSDRNVNYQLVLSNLRRVGGQAVPDRVERLRGNVTRITYEVSQSFTGANIFEYFQEQAQQKGYKQLFSCSSRDCGSSNYWANTLFQNRILNGPERNQFFMALETGDSSIEKAYLSIYVITRANRRLYAYIEVVEVGAGGALETSSLDLVALQDTGSIIVQGVEFNEEDNLSNDTGVGELARLLQENSALRLYIVGHVGTTNSNEEISQLLNRSLIRANQVRDRLISQGIDPGRISAQGVGPLAPLCSENDCANRIEAVIQ